MKIDHTSSKGSICIPAHLSDGYGRGVATSLMFQNGDDLLFPSFHYDPQTNLSSIIGLSLDNDSKVEISHGDEPVRIKFKQVNIFLGIILIYFHFSAILPS